jgi:hypothetical protein
MKTCSSCKYFNLHEQLHCAVNPECFDANQCLHHEPAFSEDIVQQALVLRQKRKFEAWRNQVLQQAEQLGVAILIDEPNYSTLWQVPTEVEADLKGELVKAIAYCQSKYPELTIEEIAIALIQYAEHKMKNWLQWTQINEDNYTFNQILDKMKIPHKEV